MSAKPEFMPCPHDIDTLLKVEKSYMPGFGLDKRKDCKVWCDDCKHWVPFDWIDKKTHVETVSSGPRK